MSLRTTGRAAAAVAAALGLLVAGAGCEHEELKAAPSKPSEVLVGTPRLEPVTDFELFTGHTEAFKMVEIRARATGYLEEIRFRDGDDVRAGAPLFAIDDRPASAQLAKARAALEQAKVRQMATEADFGRKSALFQRGTISREEYDLSAEAFAEAGAAVEVAQADLDAAEVNFSYTRVDAPIDGRLSRHMVDAGNLVSADETLLTTIVALDPIRVYFDVDERTFLRLQRLVADGEIASTQDGKVQVQVALADEDDFKHPGTIDFTDNRVDPMTGTLQVRATLPNPEPHLLAPGLFVRVRLPIGEPYEALTVAEQAVGTDQGRKFLYVVNADDEVVYRPVKVGALQEGRRVILDGIDESDRVIVSGLQRVRPGAKVVAKPFEEPEPPSAEPATPRTADLGG